LERFKESYNSGLANGVGNLTSRILTMSVSYGVRYEPVELDLPNDYVNSLNNFDLKKAMDFVWNEIVALDKQIQEKQPFKKIKLNPDEAKADLKEMLQKLYTIASLLMPMLPQTAEKIISHIESNKTLESPLFPRKE
jgi:methionyl-tRNA synthetase